MPQGMRIAKEIREELGATKYAMAIKLGITPQAWEVLESRSTNPSLKNLISLWRVARKELRWTHEKFLTMLEVELTFAEAKAKRDKPLKDYKKGKATLVKEIKIKRGE